MNELDSHLEKTSEIFKIGWIEKKLQPLKVGNKSGKIIRFYQNLKEIDDFLFKLMTSEEFKYQNVTQFLVFFTFVYFFHRFVLILDTLYSIHIHFMIFATPQNTDF